MANDQLAICNLNDDTQLLERTIIPPFSKEQIEVENQKSKEKYTRWINNFLTEDPYWRMPQYYVDPYRLEGIYNRYKKICDPQPQWKDDLLSGLPTYYSVLGVKKGAHTEEIKKAYAIKKECSIYAEDILESAYRVLISPELQMQYNEAISLIEILNRSLKPSEKKEITEEHNSWLDDEKNYLRFNYILGEHPSWVDLYELGTPTVYEILGIERSADQQHIDAGYKNQLHHNLDAKELLDEIYKILSTPHLREEYDFILTFSERYYKKELQCTIKRRKKQWSDWQPYKKLILVHLKDGDYIKKNIDRWMNIFTRNYDWENYLPPQSETFYDILDIDRNKIHEENLEKKEFEGMLRSKYREMERSPKVNLAYNVLKNINTRQEYNWMLENNEIFKGIFDITSPFEDEIDTRDEKEFVSYMKEEMTKIYGKKSAPKREKEMQTATTKEILKVPCQHDFQEILSRSKYIVYKCSKCGEINKIFK